jgi:diacylglycerol kinase family enzyme
MIHPSHAGNGAAAAPRTDGPVLLVFNRQSGRGQARLFHDAVQAACAEGQRPLVLFEARRTQELPQLAQQAVERAVREGGVVVAAGGDGTISLVAQHVLQAGVAMGVLPQGTFNYFSRTHGIPADTREAMAVVLQGQACPVQAGLVNGRVFLVNASLGLYVALIADREKAKARHGRSRWVALAAAVGTLWRGARLWDLVLTTEQGRGHIQATTVFVGNSALQLDQVGVPEAAEVARGALAGVALLPMSRLAMVGLAARAALGRLSQAREVQTFSFNEMELLPTRSRASRRVARVAIDGEIRKLDFPLRFAVSPRPLWLMTPRPAEAGA